MYFNIKNHIFISKFFLILPFWALLKIPLKPYFLTFLFTFLHEAAHFLSARIMGEKVLSLFINIFGFELCTWPKSKKNEYIIILSGPLFSLFLSAVFYFLKNAALAKINLILFLFNLCPALPLDGGKLFEIHLWERFGGAKGSAILKKISFSIAGLFITFSLLAKNLWLLFAATLILSRSRNFCHSPFYRKKCSGFPLKFYTFPANTPLSIILQKISPYNYIAVIIPYQSHILLEWQILENITKTGYCITLLDFYNFVFKT